MTDYEQMRAWLGELAAAMPEAHERVRVKRQREIDIDHRIPIKGDLDPRVERGRDMYLDMERIAKHFEIAVETVDRMKWRLAIGQSDHHGTIRVRSEATRAGYIHMAHVVAHELVHEVFHNDPVAKLPKRDETEAEGVAYLLSRRYGCYAMDSPLYLATYGISGELIERHANRIIAAALFLAGIAEGGK